jgi:RND superfamily putative drug exporter
MVPIGMNSINILGADIRTYLLDDEEDNVLSITSISNDLIIIIDGDDNLFSQPVYDWIAELSFELQINPIIQQYTKRAAPVQNIYSVMRPLLISYLTTLHLAISAANVSSYVFINGTQQLLENWNTEFQLNQTNSLERAVNTTKIEMIDTITSLSSGIFYLDFLEKWINELYEFSKDHNPDEVTYASIIDDWKINPSYWSATLGSSTIVQYIEYFLSYIDIDTLWTEDFVFTSIATILFGISDIETLEFIEELFDGGNAQSATIMGSEELIPFLRGEFLPIGFPVELRAFYLGMFTNSNGYSLANSTIVQVRLRTDLNESEVAILLDFVTEFVKSKTTNNEFGYSVFFLSEINYNKERGEQLTEELHAVDIFAIIFGFIVLYWLFKNMALALVSVLLSWLTTQVAKAAIVNILPDYFIITDAGFSMGATILLGASLNYVVFFVYRYREEILKYEPVVAIEHAMRTALHSIYISGVAIFLTFLPLTFSNSPIIQGLSTTTSFGILIELILMYLILPSFFLSIIKFNRYLGLGIVIKEKTRNIKFKLPQIFKFKVTRANTKRIIYLSLLISVLSLVLVFNSNSTIAINDFIGEEGQTGASMQILFDKYPDNYFSRVIIKIETINPIVLEYNTEMRLIDEFSKLINDTQHVANLVSPAWPLGKSFNFSDNSIAAIPRQIAKSVSSELLDGNYSYIVMQLKYGDASQQTMFVIREFQEMTKNFADAHSEIVNAEPQGYLVSTTDQSFEILLDLPVQFIIAIILLTAFLWYQLKSVSVPLRLEFTLILGTTYALALGTIFWFLLYQDSLNLVINITAVITLLGLGTDFDIYLYTRIQEEQKETHDLEKAIHQAIEKSAPAIKASGLVMAGAFMGLMLGDLRLIQQFGFITAISILIDIFLIRVVIMPAFLLLRERKN